MYRMLRPCLPFGIRLIPVLLFGMYAHVLGQSPSQNWIVRFADAMPLDQKDQAAQYFHLSEASSPRSTPYRQARTIASKTADKQSPLQALEIDQFSWAKWVEIEPDIAFYLDELPDDPMAPQQWVLGGNLQDGGGMKLPQAWKLHQGKRAFVAGIIDTGIDYQHEDLAENVWQNLAEDADGDGHTLEQINGVWQLDPGDLDGQDDDGNGYVDDLIGWDFVNDDNDPLDLHGHGTHVAGIMGAKGDNQIGIAGVNWHISLMALKAFDANGKSSLSSILEALAYARENGAQLTNNSWGGPNYSQFLYDEIEEAHEEGQLLIAAAGNGGANLLQSPIYPAAYDLPNIVSVAATDEQDAMASFSNFGVNHVDLFAPGTGILSTLPGNQYGIKSGTSMAAPYIAGAVGLVWSFAQGMDHLDIRELVLATVDVKQALTSKCATGGRVNPYETLLIASELCVDWIKETKGHHVKSLADDGFYLWAATDHGLLRLEKNSCQFTHYKKNNSPLEDDRILSVEVGVGGTVWVGTEKKGLFKIEGELWTKYDKNNSGLPDNKISALVMDDNGGIYVGTYGKGFAHFDGSNWTVYNKSNTAMPNEKIKAMVKAEDGSLWVGTDKGVAHFDQGQWTFVNKSNSSLPDDKVKALGVDAEGNIWIGTDKGLARWGTDGWEVFKKSNSILPEDKLRSITIGQDSVKWFGTKKGLVRYDDGQWILYDKKGKTLPHDAVNTLEADGHNNTWAGTDDGISVFSNQASVRFSGPKIACINDQVTFANLSTGATSYQWEVDGTIVGTQEHLDYQFSSYGEYEVKLIGSNDFSSNGYSIIVSVPEVPTIDLGADASLCASALVLDGGIEEYPMVWKNLNGQTLGNERTLTINQSGAYVLSITDGCGATSSDTLQVTLTNGCVWPGDINVDGKVNMIDFLCLGQIDGATGPARTNTSTDWASVAADDWNQSFPLTHDLAPGVNFKHADANGDGIIDIDTDGAIILQNLIYSHKSVQSGNQHGLYVDIVPTGTQFISDDTAILDFEILLKHSAGIPVSHIYGVAFSLEASHHLASTPTIETDSSWLNADASAVAHHWKSEHQNALNQVFGIRAQTDIAMTRTGITNESGDTPLLATSIIVTIDDLTDDEHALSYNVFNVQARRLVVVDSAGNTLPTIEWESNEITSTNPTMDASTTHEEEELSPSYLHHGPGISVYPNPTVNKVHVRWDETVTRPRRIQVLSLTGESLFSIEQIQGPAFHDLEMEKLGAGMYLLALEHEHGIDYQKIIVTSH